MSNVTESQYQGREEALTSQEVGEQLRALGKQNIAVPKTLIYPLIAACFFAVWIALSFANGKLFLDKIIPCCFVITCLLCFKSMEE
jgi:hypothetical protein